MSSYFSARECCEPEAFCGGSPDDALEATAQSGPLTCDRCAWTGPAVAFLVEHPDDSDPAFTTVHCLDESACRDRLVGWLGRDLGRLERDRVAAEGEVEPLPW